MFNDLYIELTELTFPEKGGAVHTMAPNRGFMFES